MYLCFIEEEYGDLKSLVSTEPEPEEEIIEMETEFSKEDDLDDYYSDYSPTSVNPQPIEEETPAPTVSTDEISQYESESPYLIFDKDGEMEEEESSGTETNSVIDKIIEEEQKTPGEKLFESIDKSKILEQILPQREETDRDSLLSKIIRMFG